LAVWSSRLVVGLFDGGVLLGETQGKDLAWKAVPGTSVWGVNALLSAEGVLFIASLRGAAQYDGRKTVSVGTGSAFSLVQTRTGIAIGYGHGVQLPDTRFLSAFHGLPGNQALALASGEDLFVGTPSGLGAISGSRVAWRVTAGDGKLPNPWVTALALFRGGLFAGTYGGGVIRRTPNEDGRPGPGNFDPFPETSGLKVNPGCLQVAGGRLYLGTEGRGLFRLSEDGTQFVPLQVPLPSPRVTALLQNGAFLLIGTDEGLVRVPLSLLREGT
jgi:ligand-binding sensor domain-containing protein